MRQTLHQSVYGEHRIIGEKKIILYLYICKQRNYIRLYYVFINGVRRAVQLYSRTTACADFNLFNYTANDAMHGYMCVLKC